MTPLILDALWLLALVVITRKGNMGNNRDVGKLIILMRIFLSSIVDLQSVFVQPKESFVMELVDL